MNINKISGINQVAQLYNSKKVSSTSNVKKAEKDKIEISDTARALNNMSSDDLEVNREKKVEQIRNQINKGTYKCDVNKIAAGILNAIKEQK